MIVALIGLGNWGYRLIPRFLNHAMVKQLHCYDIDTVRSDRVGQDFPRVKVASDYESLLKDPTIDSVVVATPAASHYLLAKKALESGKHVLVEKPLTNHADQAKHLVDLAGTRGLTLMVDHITVYSGAAQRVKKLIESETLGKIMFFDAARMNLGVIQADVSVVWDLAIHEFALIDYLIGEMPQSVSASGAAFYGTLEELADVRLSFESGMVGHVHVSWIAPIRRRELIIGGTKQMLVFDDALADAKLRLFDRGVDQSAEERARFTYRNGDCEVLDHGRGEPLVAVVEEFIDSISKGREPLTSGVKGLRCVQILAAVEKSLQKNGMSVNVV